MKKQYAVFVAGLFLIAVFTGCFGGQPEETTSVDINVSEDIKEVENLQKQVKEQSEQLQIMQSDLKAKKSSKSTANTEEVKKLEQQIDVQQKAIVQTSKKVTTVKAEKGKYIWAMFRSQPSHDFYNGYNIMPPLDFKWKFKAIAGGFKASPIMDAENIYVGSTDANFYAIEKGTGVKAWNTERFSGRKNWAAPYRTRRRLFIPVRFMSAAWITMFTRSTGAPVISYGNIRRRCRLFPRLWWQTAWFI